VSIGSNWRKDTLAAIERHEAGVALHSEFMITATAKLTEMRTQLSQKQDELESLRVIFFVHLLFNVDFTSNPYTYVYTTGVTS
jgi:hypothetical protein